jgi:hypothetical protein
MKSTEAVFLVLIFMVLVGLLPVFIMGKNNKYRTSVIIQNVSLLVLSFISMVMDYAVIQYLFIAWWVFLFFYSSAGREKSLWVKED